MKGAYFELKNPQYGYPALFLVEGKDDAIFIEEILRYLNISESDARIIVCDGKTNIGNHLGLIVKSSEFRKHIKSIVVVLDADDDYEKSVGLAHKELKRFNLPTPNAYDIAKQDGKSFGVMMFPAPGVMGDLETLALQFISDGFLLSLSEDTIKSAEAHFGEIYKKRKRVLQVFMACASKEIRPTVGWLFKDRTINIDYGRIEEIVQFISRFFPPEDDLA